MTIRLKDIARELDVFIITVSKALRGNTDISEATRQRVLERVKELDYQPNKMARSLATGHSFIVGLIVPDLLNGFLQNWHGPSAMHCDANRIVSSWPPQIMIRKSSGRKFA